MDNETIKTRRRKLTDYQPDPENANLGSERGQQMIEDSLRAYGGGRSILVDRNGVVIAGNKTQEGAVAAGIENVIEVETDGSELVVVRRRDLDLLNADDTRARILAYVDNRAAQVSLTWNAAQLLADMKSGVPLGGVFTEEEMKALIASAVTRSDDGPAARIDQIEEVHAKWQAQSGDLWIVPAASGIGAHRILCGDSTNADDVRHVLAGMNPVIMVTDPPYGVEYDPQWRADYADSPRYSLGTVSNDDRVDWGAALRLFPGDVMYVWHAGVFAGEVAASIYTLGFQLRAQIIWRKQVPVMSRGAYHWQHEPCFYAVRKGKNANWQGDRKQSTVWDVANMSNAGSSDEDTPTGHSTQKPLEVMRRPIINHTLPGDHVYDPFLGAGTTLVAAEMVGRVGAGIEIDPRYVSLTLQRFEDMGLSPEKSDAS